MFSWHGLLVLHLWLFLHPNLNHDLNIVVYHGMQHGSQLDKLNIFFLFSSALVLQQGFCLIFLALGLAMLGLDCCLFLFSTICRNVSINVPQLSNSVSIDMFAFTANTREKSSIQIFRVKNRIQRKIYLKLQINLFYFRFCSQISYILKFSYF